EIDRQLIEEKMPFRADEMLSLEYDEASWIFRVIVSPKLFNRLLPQMVGETCFTGFSFNDSAIFINIGTEK
ncbi:MAG: hypothetical protein KAI33_06240, partial [Elusimicrobiales bacterium]|nr:hypothetical protein [Elusimicrobiales bacterium]